MGHMLRSSGLLRVEASRATVSQFASTGGGATAGGAHGTIMKVALS
jgi:hypothetical protein